LKEFKHVVNKQIEDAFVNFTADENEEPEKPVKQEKKEKKPVQANKRKRVLKESSDDGKRKKRPATTKRVIEDSDNDDDKEDENEDDNEDDNEDGSDDFMDAEDTPKKASEDEQSEEEDVKPKAKAKAKTVKKVREGKQPAMLVFDVHYAFLLGTKTSQYISQSTK
jgi:hypothetical protein